MVQAVRATALTVLLGLTAACAPDPGAKYDDFLERADRRGPEVEKANVQGALTDVGDTEFLLNIALNPIGDVALRLRLLFTSFVPDPMLTEAAVSGEFRFENEDRSVEPAATFDTVMDSNGRMIISTGVVFVPADRSPVMDVAVETEFNLATFVLDEESLCGQIEDDESRVIQPISLELKGTTFGGKAFGPDGTPPTDVPNACPAEDAGAVGNASDAGDAGS